MTDMIEVTIDSVRVSLTNQQRIVVLREVGTERYLPIWIGPYEAEAITIALQDIEVARPQTHDLLKNFLAAMDARLVRVEVISLSDDVFYGNLVIEVNGKFLNIDSRPSDALALSVRANAPIMVSRQVMESASITPEQDLQKESTTDETGTSDEAKSLDPKMEEENQERLSIFEEFLNTMDSKDSSVSSSDQDVESDDEDMLDEDK